MVDVPTTQIKDLPHLAAVTAAMHMALQAPDALAGEATVAEFVAAFLALGLADERIRDVIGTALVGTGLVNVTHDDDGNEILVGADAFGVSNGNALAVHTQTMQQRGLYLQRDGTWRNPLEVGTGVVSAGSITTISNDSTYLAWPVVCRLNDGRLLAAYTTASGHHSANDGIAVGKFGTESPDGTITWGSQFTIYNDASLWCAVYGITQISTGRIFATLWRDNWAVNDTGEAGLVYSDDDGVTWSAWVDLDGPSAFTLESYSAGPVIELTNGHLLVPVEGRNSGDGALHQSVKAVKSTDGGTTWGSPVTIRTYAADTRPYFETNLVLMRSGRILAVHRTSDAAGNCYTSYSDDYGATWSVPVLAFAGHGNPHTIQLSTGTLVCITRQNTSQCPVAYTSIDEGGAWSAGVVVDSSTDDMMYGCPVELFDGRVLVVYSLERSGSNADILQAYLTETLSASGAGVAVEDQGVSEGTGITTLNFTGAGVTVSVTGSEASVAIAGSAPGSGGYDEGSSFPGSPATGDKFYRTDRNILYFYDGTRWLTVDEKPLTFPTTGAVLSASSQYCRMPNPEVGRYGGLYITRAAYHFEVTGTGVWTLELYTYEGNVATVRISEASSTTGGVRVGVGEDAAIVVANTVESIEAAAIKTSGSASFTGSMSLVYRGIG